MRDHLERSAIRDPYLRTAVGTRGTIRIPLAEVARVERADGPASSGVTNFALHKVPDARWLSSGSGVNGAAAQDDVNDASIAVPTDIAVGAAAVISELASKCGAPLSEQKS